MASLFKVIIIAALGFFIWTRVLDRPIPSQITEIGKNIPVANQILLPTAQIRTEVKQPVIQYVTSTPPIIYQQPALQINPTNESECFIMTAKDGHQLCSDGRTLKQGDIRKQPGYCSIVQDVYGNKTCANGMPAGMVVEVWPEPTEAPWPTAIPNTYTFSNNCVDAVGPYGNQHVCAPNGETWSDGTASFVAQEIKDGKIEPGQTTGAHG